MVNHSLNTMGDKNPIYVDEDTAKAAGIRHPSHRRAMRFQV